jgi:hypothetical protein
MNWLGKTTLRAQDVMDKQKENAKTGKNDKQAEAARAFLRVRFTEATGHRCEEMYAEAEKEGITVPAGRPWTGSSPWPERFHRSELSDSQPG